MRLPAKRGATALLLAGAPGDRDIEHHAAVTNDDNAIGIGAYIRGVRSHDDAGARTADREQASRAP